MLPVTVNCLHFSVRQLLEPQTAKTDGRPGDARRSGSRLFGGALRLPARPRGRATDAAPLYGRLRPGGRLLLGNWSRRPTAPGSWTTCSAGRSSTGPTESMLRPGRRVSRRPPSSVGDHARRHRAVRLPRRQEACLICSDRASRAIGLSARASAHSRRHARGRRHRRQRLHDAGGAAGGCCCATNVASLKVQAPAREHDERASASSAAVAKRPAGSFSRARITTASTSEGIAARAGSRATPRARARGRR